MISYTQSNFFHLRRHRKLAMVLLRLLAFVFVALAFASLGLATTPSLHFLQRLPKLCCPMFSNCVDFRSRAVTYFFQLYAQTRRRLIFTAWRPLTVLRKWTTMKKSPPSSREVWDMLQHSSIVSKGVTPPQMWSTLACRLLSRRQTKTGPYPSLQSWTHEKCSR